jgi:hypothetical protein
MRRLVGPGRAHCHACEQQHERRRQGQSQYQTHQQDLHVITSSRAMVDPTSRQRHCHRQDVRNVIAAPSSRHCRARRAAAVTAYDPASDPDRRMAACAEEIVVQIARRFAPSEDGACK